VCVGWLMFVMVVVVVGVSGFCVGSGGGGLSMRGLVDLCGGDCGGC
jgi:hypothetical protein